MKWPRKHKQLMIVHHVNFQDAIQYIESVGNSKRYEFIQYIRGTEDHITLWYGWVWKWK